MRVSAHTRRRVASLRRFPACIKREFYSSHGRFEPRARLNIAATRQGVEPVTDSGRRIPHGPAIDRDLTVHLEKLLRFAWADSSCCLRGIPVFFIFPRFVAKPEEAWEFLKGIGFEWKEQIDFQEIYIFPKSSMEEISTLSETTLMIETF